MSYISDRVFHTGDRWLLPVVEASVPGWIKHVHCSGSRDHVCSYGGWVSRKRIHGQLVCVTTCSEPRCIVNLEAAELLEEHGHGDRAAALRDRAGIKASPTGRQALGAPDNG